MPSIHVCPLSMVSAEAARLMPSALLTLLAPVGQMPTRPPHLDDKSHMLRLFHDISRPMDGHTPPSEDDVRAILDFGRAWDRQQPILIHCFAGISRSTAAAYMIAADLYPHVGEDRLALRLRAASASATPNARMIEMADDVLGRRGRMIDAIEAIGFGELTSQGRPFQFDPE